jgi:hypothetical protein
MASYYEFSKIYDFLRMDVIEIFDLNDFVAW